MTKAQEKAVQMIRNLVDKWCEDRYEIKEWEVKDCDTFLSVVVCTGLPNDENTMAFLTRDRAHLFVGPRGGITYPVMKDGKTTYKRFKGYSILQAVVDQKVS